ncbi:50S ribosomal protein L1, partial [mine drainage metagenome]
MAKMTKRTQVLRAQIDRARSYAVTEALELVKKTATAKFDESVDVAVNLGVDAKKSDQQVRGSVVLPKGTGKTMRVAVFAQGDNAEKARVAGADIVGFE